MRLGHIVPSLEERYGGPSKSVRALANAQASLGDAVEILSTVEPGRTIAPGPDASHLEVFPRRRPFRLCRSPELRRYLGGVSYDCLHSHSLWLMTLRYAGQTARRLGTPLVISPRGMLSGWAYAHHRWRKRCAEFFIHPGAFRSAAGWHATSPEEADDIRRLGFQQPVCVSPNGVALPSAAELAAQRAAWWKQFPELAERPVVLFYSRFHRKKRLRELLGLWHSAPRGDWQLLIAGLPEEFSLAEVQTWTRGGPSGSSVIVVDSTGLPPPYAVASLFLLPSHSENFGLVIAEALAAGVPALVTDSTPWRGLAANGAGWCVPWENYDAALQAALTTGAAGLAAMGERGRAWMAKEFSWERAAGLLRDFYRELTHD